MKKTSIIFVDDSLSDFDFDFFDDVESDDEVFSKNSDFENFFRRIYSIFDFEISMTTLQRV